MPDQIENRERLSSVRAKLNALIAENELFDSYSDIAAWIAAGNVPTAGREYRAGGLSFIGSTGATSIPDLPGLVPNGVATPEHFHTGGADYTAAIQAAIDYCNSIGGGIVFGDRAKTYLISQAGTHRTSTRGYCLMLKSNVTLDGVSVTYVRTSETVDLIVTPSLGDVTNPGNENITVRDVTIDGNADSAETGQGMNIWFLNVKNLVIENLRTINSTAFGLRIEQCDTVNYMGGIARHNDQVNADGIHYVDCRNVSHVGGNIYTDGDDGFIIEATNYDTFNFNVTGLVVQTPAIGRGILILRDHNVGSTVRKLYNLNVTATVENAYGSALVTSLGFGELTGSTFNITANNCRYGAAIFAGGAGNPGLNRGNVYNLVIHNPYGAATAVQSILNGGVLTDNVLNCVVYNPADGASGVSLAGSGWTGNILVDYDPKGTKTTFGVGVDLTITNSRLGVVSRGAGRNIYMRNGCSQNTILLGVLRDAVTADIELLGSAASTLFMGGATTGPVVGATSATKFVGTSTSNTALFVGDYGVGSSVLELVTDWNSTSRRTGIYRTSSASVTGTVPNAYSGFSLTGSLHEDHIDGGSIVQTWVSLGTQEIWFRRYTAAAWGTWRRLNQTISGTTAARPTTGLIVGQEYFDTTLGRPIWRNAGNTAWVDATGATV